MLKTILLHYLLNLDNFLECQKKCSKRYLHVNLIFYICNLLVTPGYILCVIPITFPNISSDSKL